MKKDSLKAIFSPELYIILSQISSFLVTKKATFTHISKDIFTYLTKLEGFN